MKVGILTGACRKLAPIDHSRFKLEAGVDLDDKEFAEIAGALDLHFVGDSFGGDGFDFNQIIAKATV